MRRPSIKPLESMRGYVLRRFRVTERGSTIPLEIFAGITTYLSLSFVFILNPAILGAALPDGQGVSMSPASILLATVITASAATICMGLFANLPLAVGPGIEISAFFTYILVRRMGLTWEEALMAVVISGALNVALTSLSIRQKIVESIPPGLKSALLLCIGVFVLLVGLKLGGIVDFRTYTVPLFLERDFWSPASLMAGPFVLLVGLSVSALLNIRRLRLPWGTLVGIIAGAIACHAAGVSAPSYHGLEAESWFQTFGKASFSAVTSLSFWSGVIILFVIDFVGGISKIYALTEDTSIPRENDKVPGLRQALYVDGVFTFIGGWLGSSSLIAFVESRIGIQAGGRTGIMAIVCGILMLAGGMFSSLLVLIPPQAAAGVLIYVGFLLIRLNAKIILEKSSQAVDWLIAAIMSLSVLFTFQMDYAMLLGFGPYFVLARKRGASLGSTFWLGLVALFLFITIIPHLGALLSGQN